MFSHGNGYKFLKKFFPVHRILGFHMYYTNNKVSSFLTGTINTIKFPLMALASLQYPVAFLKHKPDIVITDFEPFLMYWAKVFSVPTISIDNQHSITNTQIDRIKSQWLTEVYSRAVIHTFLPNPDKTIITTFFSTPIIKDNTILVQPIIRPEVQKLRNKNNKTSKNNKTPRSEEKQQDKEHIFVYQTSPSYKRMIPVLKKINRQFIMYGFNKETKEANLTFKKFNTEEYLEDLATADAVIINGGFTVLSEALFLQKPIFSIPIKRQFEQIINGHYINVLQYGMAVKDINEQNFTKFLERKELYRKNIKKIKWDGNKALFKLVEQLIMK
ncbi:MAG: glycosyltransferase family protein, partial [Nanoarchaeota archaeon]